MKHFKSGEIYDVLIKNNDGYFSNHNQSSSDSDKSRSFLIHVVLTQVRVNDKLENIIFFRDVTFCILHEQIKAKEKLSSIINDTMN